MPADRRWQARSGGHHLRAPPDRPLRSYLRLLVTFAPFVVGGDHRLAGPRARPSCGLLGSGNAPTRARLESRARDRSGEDHGQLLVDVPAPVLPVERFSEAARTLISHLRAELRAPQPPRSAGQGLTDAQQGRGQVVARSGSGARRVAVGTPQPPQQSPRRSRGVRSWFLTTTTTTTSSSSKRARSWVPVWVALEARGTITL